MKILVIQKKKIGDVLISTVLFEILKEKFPSAKIHYLIYENSSAVVQNNPNIDKIVILKEQVKNSLFKFIYFLFEIRKENYDIIIDCYGKPNSVLISALSGAAKKIGFKKGYTDFFYSDTVQRTKESFSVAKKAIEHRMLLLEPLGISFRLVSPKIYLSFFFLSKYGNFSELIPCFTALIGFFTPQVLNTSIKKLYSVDELHEFYVFGIENSDLL